MGVRPMVRDSENPPELCTELNTACESAKKVVYSIHRFLIQEFNLVPRSMVATGNLQGDSTDS